MEAASEFYISYIRHNVIWILLLGFAYITYRKRHQWIDLQWKGNPKFEGGGFLSFLRYRFLLDWVSIRLMLPYVVWMLVVGVPATALDYFLGPN